MIYDHARLERILPNGLRVQDYEWAMIVEPVLQRLGRTINSDPPTERWLEEYPIPAEAHTSYHEQERQRRHKRLASMRDTHLSRALAARSEAEAIRQGHFRIDEGRLVLSG